MPSNKKYDNPADKPLTRRQEAFAQAHAIEGLSQRQSYIKAGYKCGSWTDAMIDTQACLMLKKPNVLKRVNQLLAEQKEKDLEKAIWTREQSVEAAKYLFDIGRRETDRIEAAYNEEIEELTRELEEALDNDNLPEAKKIKEKLQNKKRSKRVGMTPVVAMNGAVTTLNKMHGFEKDNISVVANIQFTGDNELKE